MASFDATDAAPTRHLDGDPGASNRFGGWTGDCTGSNSTCTVTMSKNRGLESLFVRQYSVVVTTSGSGTVTSTSSPSQASQISCPGTCTRIFDAFGSVTLTAAPGGGQMFNGWGGACASFGTATTCTLTDADASNKTVSAAFVVMTTTNPVTVTSAGPGRVTSTSVPSQAQQLDCPPGGIPCTVNFATNAQVTLTATPG
jgi:hypothetical protein